MEISSVQSTGTVESNASSGASASSAGAKASMDLQKLVLQLLKQTGLNLDVKA